MKTKYRAVILLCLLCICSLLTQTGLAYDCLTYLYGSTTQTYLNRVSKTGSNLNIVCPDYFELDTAGSMKYSKTVDPLLISTLHEAGISVTPFLSNHWDRAKAQAMLAKRGQVAVALAQAVSQHGLDGLDIDIQNITPSEKSDFTDFIRLLRAALPTGKTLTVCVPANPYYTNQGWQGAYDYKALAGYADHIFIMTYDESYPGGPPGAVASYWFVETSIKFGLQYVPKEKLMIGIPFYGRYWTDAVKGDAFTVSDIEWLTSNTQSTVWYDSTQACARATVYIPVGTTVTTWGGRKISGGLYDIWYENDASYEKKVSLVRKYGIKGVGSWALGQEPTRIWGNFSAWLNGYPFTDIKGHWAQSYIIDMYNTGLINGRTQDLFDPGGSLTRAEAAAMLIRLTGADTKAAGGFADTQGHWASEYINAAKEYGLVSGITDTRFDPNAPVTREQFAVMADRYTNIEDTFDMYQVLYSDVTPQQNTWSNKAIVKLSLNEVFTGYPDGTFQPGKPVSRAEAVKILTLLKALPTRFLPGEILPLNRTPMGPR